MTRPDVHADMPQLIFQYAIGQQKPFTMRDEGHISACPFCDHSLLPPIRKRDGDILLVPNKYPILKGSDPFVLIETAECDSELSLYTEDHLVRVFRMGFEAWYEMMDDKRYKSVLFLKNHGPYSGGSLRHPHMQLIGLFDIDYLTQIRREHFYGPVIYRASGAELNISDHPRVGYTEFNIVLTDRKDFSIFCLLIQKAVQYILKRHHGGLIGSYNLFFYLLDGLVYCKVMPRYATTPIFMGYSIPQVMDNLDSIVEEVRQYCFPSE